MTDTIATNHLQRDVARAIKWAAAEHKYIVELKEDLAQISRENSAGTKEKNIRKAIHALRYVGLSERRTFRFEQRVEGDLKKVYVSLSTEIGFDFSSVQKIREGIESTISEMRIEDRELLKYASMYEGLLRHGLNEAEAQIQLLEEIETEYPDKAQKISVELQIIISKVIKEVEEIDIWVSALVVSLDKAQELVKDFKPGLMSVNVFIEKLIEGVVENKLLQKISDAQRLKNQVEKFALVKDYSNPLLLAAQKELTKNQDGKALIELSKFSSQFNRIKNILEKIEKSNRYASLRSKVVLLNKLFDIFFGPLFEALKINLKDQSNSLAKNDFYRFLVLFQEQKGQLALIAPLFEKFGLEVYFDQVVRSGFNMKLAQTLTQEIKETHKNMGTVFTSFLILITLVAAVTSPLWYPPVFVVNKIKSKNNISDKTSEGDIGKTNSLEESGNISSLDTEELKKYIAELTTAKLEYSSQTVEMARVLHKTYSLTLLGKYTFEHLEYLRKILRKFKPSEVERFLKTVVFIDGNSSDFGVDHAGLYLSTKKGIRVFLMSDWKDTIEHEIAHARSYGLPKSWYAKWEEVNNLGLLYSDAQKYAIKKKSSSESQKHYNYWIFEECDSGPILGFARPYSVTNIEEDIATFTELVEGGTIFRSIQSDGAFLFLPFLEIYEQKARLLMKFGFVQRTTAHKFISHLKLFQVKANTNIVHLKKRVNAFAQRNSLPKKINSHIEEYLDQIEEAYWSRLGLNFKRKWIKISFKGLLYSQARKRVENKTLIDWGKEGVDEIFSYRGFLDWLRYGFIVSSGTIDWKEDVKTFVKFADEMVHNHNIEIGWTSTVLLLPYLDTYNKKFQLLGQYDLISNAKSLMARMESLKEYFQKSTKYSWGNLNKFEQGGVYKEKLSSIDKEDLKRARDWLEKNIPEE